MKAMFDLCPGALRDRYKRERKEKLWQPFNEEALFQVQSKLNELSNQKQSSKAPSDSAVSSTSNFDDQSKSSSTETKSNDLTEVKVKLDKKIILKFKSKL